MKTAADHLPNGDTLLRFWDLDTADYEVVLELPCVRAFTVRLSPGEKDTVVSRLASDPFYEPRRKP